MHACHLRRLFQAIYDSSREHEHITRGREQQRTIEMPATMSSAIAGACLPRHAAVDGQHLAGHVAGGGAGEEQDAGGDVFGEADPLAGIRFSASSRIDVAEDLGHVAFDEAGADGVDRHLAAGQFAAEAAGEADEAGLAEAE